nr:MAG TPA: hypothetical protein [Caudoviricetes sp.]
MIGSTPSPISLSQVRSDDNGKNNHGTCIMRRRTVCTESSMLNL